MAYSSFSLMISSLLYLGKLMEKKHVCALGKNMSGLFTTSLPSLFGSLVVAPASVSAACILNFCVNSAAVGGRRLRAHTNRRNCCRCSEVNDRSTRQKLCTWGSSGLTSSSYSVLRCSRSMFTSPRPHMRSSISRHENSDNAAEGTMDDSPSRMAAAASQLSNSRACSTARQYAGTSPSSTVRVVPPGHSSSSVPSLSTTVQVRVSRHAASSARALSGAGTRFPLASGRGRARYH